VTVTVQYYAFYKGRETLSITVSSFVYSAKR
jgi:hypothetical protein